MRTQSVHRAESRIGGHLSSQEKMIAKSKLSRAIINNEMIENNNVMRRWQFHDHLQAYDVHMQWFVDNMLSMLMYATKMISLAGYLATLIWFYFRENQLKVSRWLCHLAKWFPLEIQWFLLGIRKGRIHLLSVINGAQLDEALDFNSLFRLSFHF